MAHRKLFQKSHTARISPHTTMKISCIANNPDDELCTISAHDLISKLLFFSTGRQILTQVQFLITWKNLREYYRYKADCLSNVLHCYSIHFKFCHFCFESATLSKSYCIGIIFLKLLFYRFIIIIREIIRRIECLGAINLRLMQKIMTFAKVN